MASIVQFQVHFTARRAPDDVRLAELGEWCVRFNRAGLTPYFGGNGRSLGNLSFRLAPGRPAFVITGSALDSKEHLTPEDFVVVTGADPAARTVTAEGLRDPSSESIMHYEIYRLRPEIGAVFHGHDPEILAAGARLGLPETGRREPPGTVALLEQVKMILSAGNFLMMKEHGFLALGGNMSEAGELALRIKRKAAARENMS